MHHVRSIGIIRRIALSYNAAKHFKEVEAIMHTPVVVRRPQREFASALLQVTKGCTYGKCLFCNLYTEEPFEIIPMQHIEEDLDEIAATVRDPQRVLFVGGNPMGLPNSKLVPVLEMIREKLPTVKTISGYMKTADIKMKTDEELAQMAELGVSDVTIGTECGWNPALERVNKDHTVEDILQQYPRLDAAGIGYSLFYLPGIAGAGKSIECGRESAKVYSQVNPIRITLLSMTPYPGSPLREEVQAGTFEMAPESEIILDAAEFIDGLTCETLISGSHDANLFRIDGILPRDKEGMVATLKWRAENINDKAVAGIRMRMLSM